MKSFLLVICYMSNVSSLAKLYLYLNLQHINNEHEKDSGNFQEEWLEN